LFKYLNMGAVCSMRRAKHINAGDRAESLLRALPVRTGQETRLAMEPSSTQVIRREPSGLEKRVDVIIGGLFDGLGRISIFKGGPLEDLVKEKDRCVF